MEEPQHRSMDSSSRLIFWILSFLSVVMTTIGGATAAHIVSQSDEMLNRLSKIESSISANEVWTKDFERRIEYIEKKVIR